MDGVAVICFGFSHSTPNSCNDTVDMGLARLAVICPFKMRGGAGSHIDWTREIRSIGTFGGAFGIFGTATPSPPLPPRNISFGTTGGRIAPLCVARTPTILGLGTAVIPAGNIRGAGCDSLGCTTVTILCFVGTVEPFNCCVVAGLLVIIFSGCCDGVTLLKMIGLVEFDDDTSRYWSGSFVIGAEIVGRTALFN